MLPTDKALELADKARPWHIWERLARHRAAKFGYRLHRTRRRWGPDNAGQYILIHKASSIIMFGAGFTATLAMILDFLEQPENQHGPKSGIGALAPTPVNKTRIPTRVTAPLRKWGDSWWINPRTRLLRNVLDLEHFAYYQARKVGYRVRRSRKRESPRGFMLIEGANNTVLFGSDYSATIESILEFLERERLQ
jgi:hypothetical protein